MKLSTMVFIKVPQYYHLLPSQDHIPTFSHKYKKESKNTTPQMLTHAHRHAHALSEVRLECVWCVSAEVGGAGASSVWQSGAGPLLLQSKPAPTAFFFPIFSLAVPLCSLCPQFSFACYFRPYFLDFFLTCSLAPLFSLPCYFSQLSL